MPTHALNNTRKPANPLLISINAHHPARDRLHHPVRQKNGPTREISGDLPRPKHGFAAKTRQVSPESATEAFRAGYLPLHITATKPRAPITCPFIPSAGPHNPSAKPKLKREASRPGRKAAKPALQNHPPHHDHHSFINSNFPTSYPRHLISHLSPE